jgi:hypothetical protein
MARWLPHVRGRIHLGQLWLGATPYGATLLQPSTSSCGRGSSPLIPLVQGKHRAFGTRCRAAWWWVAACSPGDPRRRAGGRRLASRLTSFSGSRLRDRRRSRSQMAVTRGMPRLQCRGTNVPAASETRTGSEWLLHGPGAKGPDRVQGRGARYAREWRAPLGSSDAQACHQAGFLFEPGSTRSRPPTESGDGAGRSGRQRDRASMPTAPARQAWAIRGRFG